jgi:hypothetical protein
MCGWCLGFTAHLARRHEAIVGVLHFNKAQPKFDVSLDLPDKKRELINCHFFEPFHLQVKVGSPKLTVSRI